jgi:hypothetical protein
VVGVGGGPAGAGAPPQLWVAWLPEPSPELPLLDQLHTRRPPSTIQVHVGDGGSAPTAECIGGAYARAPDLFEVVLAFLRAEEMIDFADRASRGVNCSEGTGAQGCFQLAKAISIGLKAG